MIKNSYCLAFSLVCLSFIPHSVWAENTANKTTKANLGESLFFDTALSLYQNQNCASCHDPKNAFTDGRESKAKGSVSEGSDGHSFGNRNAPTAGYAQFSPKFHFNSQTKRYVGGQFLDGRASDLAEQAGGPPLNPVEMAMPDKKTIIDRLKTNIYYYDNFIHLYGNEVWNNEETAYAAMQDAIAHYEQTTEFSPFDSKYDRYLRGEYELTPLEDLGRTLFFSNNNLKCVECHTLSKQEDQTNETFTNYEYHNIGVPSNPELIALNNLPANFKDEGLAENPAITDPQDRIKQRGKFKVPTLRNVAVTGPYMHNGVFKDLRTVVLFYDKYSNPENIINPETGQPWQKPEVSGTLSIDKLLAKKLNDRKVDALVAFMETLTDKRYEPLLEQKKKMQQAR